jgi:L-amino acid N-acyltransferase YncA
VQLRLATLDDAEEMRTIYNLEVETSTATFDLVTRSSEDQRAWLAERSGAHAAVVAVNDGEVVGFASLSPYKERAAYRTTVEDSVYVRRDHHGQGIGKALLGEMLDVARRHGFHAVMARIEATREPSVALHRACGFELVGIEREVGRKFNRWLDIALMQRLLDGSN